MDGSFAFFLVICTLFGIAGGLQGRSKDGSFLLWFAIAACLPLFGFLAALVWPGHRHELRRRCDGCGRVLPITDTMCMGCGTDLGFPETRYHSVAGSEVAGAGGAAPEGPGDAGDEPSPYERAGENPYETAAEAAPTAAGTGAPRSA